MLELKLGRVVVSFSMSIALAAMPRMAAAQTDPGSPAAPAQAQPGEPAPVPPPAAAPTAPPETLPPTAAPAAEAPPPEAQPAPAAETAPVAPVAPPPDVIAPPPESSAPPPEPASAEPHDSLGTEARDGKPVRFVPGKGFELATEDGDFALQLRLRAQFLYHYLSRVGEDRQALQVRRARVTFAGHMWGPEIKYKVELAFSPRDVGQDQVTIVGSPDAAVTGDGGEAELITEHDVVGTSPLLDYYVDFGHLRDLGLRVGQTKIPFSRQRVVSSGDLQFVDRALTNSEFNLDRDIGLDLFSNDLGGLGILRYHAGVFIGEGRNSSDRSTGWGDRGYLYNLRLELLPLGSFADYKEADLDRGEEPKFAIGAAYALMQSDATSPYAEDPLGSALGGSEVEPVVDFNAHNVTADAVFKMAGFSAQTAFHFRSIAGLSASPSVGREGIGWMIAAGFVLPSAPVEIAAAYAMVRGKQDSALGDENEVGLGLNYYPAGHMLKLQLDAFHLWDDAGFGEGDDRVRLQLQASL